MASILFESLNAWGNISQKIKDETGFNVNWEGKPGNVGCNYVIIPKEKFTEKLKKEILDKYNTL